MITIVDYGLGNLKSIQNMIKRIGYNSTISNDPDVIEKATVLILPGVGSFDYGMNQLMNSSFVHQLNSKVLTEKIPALGICLGMQMLGNSSEEGISKGLGWIKGTVKKIQLPDNSSLRIPHMGWTQTYPSNNSKILTDLESPRFYYVHSYHFVLENTSEEILYAEHGDRFTSAVEKDNIVGVQFHPEKSHKYGMKLLSNFLRFY